MKRALCVLLFCACAGPQAAYAPEDPLARSPQAELVTAEGASFSVVFPDGYADAEGQLSPPLLSMRTKDLPSGEAAVMVEWYPEAGGVRKESFLANLGEGVEKRRALHK